MTDDPHLDLLELDALRAGNPPTAVQRAHLAWCEPCRAALTDLETLATGLRRLAADVTVPAERDAAILAAARRRADLAARQAVRSRPWTGRAGRWAAAAMLVVAIGALTVAQRRVTLDAQRAAAPAARATLTASQSDLDGDGRVTVLDAFALARAVTRGTPRLGGADRHDVDAILAMAVALDEAQVDDQ